MNYFQNFPEIPSFSAGINQPLKTFYDGAFKLAVDSKKDIMPGIIVGTSKAMPINKPFFLKPTRLKMRFLPVVSSADISSKELKEKIFSIMLKALADEDK